MDDDFEDSIFSSYFNFSFYLGSWAIITDNKIKKLLYLIYFNLVSAWVLFISYMGILDLIDSMPDINKVVYNISLNLFIIGTWAKSMCSVRKYKRINRLRRNLHRSFSTCKDAEEVSLYNRSVKDIKFISNLFFVFLVWLYPSWLMLSLFSDYWGPRETPLPAKWPGDIDIYDTQTFVLIVVFHGSFALFYLGQALSLECSTFGSLAQIYREYRFLLKRIREFGEFCEDLYPDNVSKICKNKSCVEINMYLKKALVKQRLGGIVQRQMELLIYTQEFEYSYNLLMFVHIFAGGLLLCINGVQAMIVSINFNAKIAYQFGYVLTIISDMLYLSWLNTRISTKCSEVGNALYQTPWYKMDVKTQRDIHFVILRSQKHPRITAGNFVELELQTFMVMMKNLYSWLALFRQVALK